jgi:hypothetical protein
MKTPKPQKQLLPELDIVYAIIGEAQAFIKRVQDNCEHSRETLVGKHDADTGNWDRGDDSYWIDFHCQICDKRWRVDSEDPEYRTREHWDERNQGQFWKNPSSSPIT